MSSTLTQLEGSSFAIQGACEQTIQVLEVTDRSTKTNDDRTKRSADVVMVSSLQKFPLYISSVISRSGNTASTLPPLEIEKRFYPLNFGHGAP